MRTILHRQSLACAGIALMLICAPLQAAPGAVGLFDGQSDVGRVTPPGTASYDPARDSYTLTSAGHQHLVPGGWLSTSSGRK